MMTGSSANPESSIGTPSMPLLSILDTIGLAFNQEKCVLFISELDFLVRRISATGVRLPSEQRLERAAERQGKKDFIFSVNSPKV
jgi:hypothetical protein